MVRSTVLVFCAAVMLSVPAAPAAQTTVLYDGSLGSTPASQGWLYQTSPGASATQSAAGGVTTLTTTAVLADQAGYGKNPIISLPVLDRAAGYTIVFDVRIDTETHLADDRDGDGVDDRAGFSLIALSSDLAGIEIAFWGDEIWAYEYEDVGGGFDFTHAEGAQADTTAAMQRYQLAVEGSAYALYGDGGPPLLSGPLRNYSPKGAPYNVPSFLFLGDDTTKAGAVVELAYVAHVNEAVPEPACLCLLALGGLCMATRRRRA